MSCQPFDGDYDDDDYDDDDDDDDDAMIMMLAVIVVMISVPFTEAPNRYLNRSTFKSVKFKQPFSVKQKNGN